MEKLNDILVKVAVLFRKYGIKSITMDDIAREIGISKKTLYQFVTDKNDLVNKVIDDELSRTKECFELVWKKENNAISELLEVNKFMLEMLKRNSPSFEYDLKKHYPEVFQKIIQARRKGMYESVLANLKKGKAEGFYREELNEEVITKLQVSRLENMYSDVIFSIEDYSVANIFIEIFIYHIRGIANERGIKYLEENIHRLYNTESDLFKEGEKPGTIG